MAHYRIGLMEDPREERRNEILRALVELHIKTGEPVSSKSVLESTNLHVSAATVRSELAALEREGYAHQPHTSAGRVPTSRAYRYYVDHLRPGKLRTPTQARIETFYATIHHELGRLLQATTDLLSDMTRYPAVAVSPGPSGETVKSLHLVQVADTTALTVVVTDSGRIVQELTRLPKELTAQEIELTEQVLARAVVGKALLTDPVSLAGDTELAPAVTEAADAVAAAIARTGDRSADIYVGGATQMATVWDNISTVHRVLEVLEAEAKLLNILAGERGTHVQIGDELPIGPELDVAVVSTSYESHAGDGRVGVIGPVRMDYKRVIRAVEGVGRELGERIGE
jgi:heat-inducible transcriptional repressor